MSELSEKIVYVEHRAGCKKRIELYSDRVFVKITTKLGVCTEETFSLANLQPYPVKAKLLKSRLVMLIGLFLFSTLPFTGYLLYLLSGRIKENNLVCSDAVILTIVLLGSILCFLWGRQLVEYVVFRTHAGVSAFSFTRDVNKPDDFDLMTQKIVERIEAVQGKSS